MKKIIAIAIIAVMMIMMCSVSAFAEFSPTATPNNDNTTGTSTSPQTGDNTAVLFGSLALLMAGAASVVAVKKVKG